MLSTKVLEMLNQGRVEELKDLLRDEIYQDALKKKPGAKQRYAAMKKYFGYVRMSGRTCCQKPAMIEFEGKTVTSFCNSYSLALTSEPCGGIALFAEDDGNYPDVGRLVKRDGTPHQIDICKVIAEAKAKGYKLTKAEVNGTPTKFMMLYEGSYFRLGLIDATYSIIDNGKPATAYIKEGGKATLTIENDIGLCLVLPVNRVPGNDDEEHDITVIEVE